MSRPWSPAEVEQKVPELSERLNDAVTLLQAQGIAAAMTEWDYRAQMAKAQVRASSEGKNADERNGLAIGYLVEGKCKVSGYEHLHAGIARDLARNAYSDSRHVINAIQSEMDIARTLLASARRANADGGYNS